MSVRLLLLATDRDAQTSVWCGEPRHEPRNSGECVFGCEQILNLIEETLSGCTLYKNPALYLNA